MIVVDVDDRIAPPIPTTTTLDRVSIRRMMFFIEKQMRQKLRQNLYYFQSDDDAFNDLVDFSYTFMCDIQDRKGCQDFKISSFDKTLTLELLPLRGKDWVSMELKLNTKKPKSRRFMFF